MSQCGGTGFWCTDLTDDVPGTGFCFSELSEVLGIGIDVVSILVTTPVQTSTSVTEVTIWYRTELTKVSGTGMKVCTGTGGTGIHVVPNLPKCPVPILMSCRAYRSVWYLYWCRTELTEVSGIGNTGGIYRWYPSIPAEYTVGMPRYVPYRTHSWYLALFPLCVLNWLPLGLLFDSQNFVSFYYFVDLFFWAVMFSVVIFSMWLYCWRVSWQVVLVVPSTMAWRWVV